MKLALTLIGSLAEFAALALVVRDFYDARDRADALLRPTVEPLPEPQTDEERERRRAADLKAQVVFALTAPSRQDVQTVAEAIAYVQAQFADSLRGSPRRLKWSIGLLAVGIACSAIANLI